MVTRHEAFDLLVGFADASRESLDRRIATVRGVLLALQDCRIVEEKGYRRMQLSEWCELSTDVAWDLLHNVECLSISQYLIRHQLLCDVIERMEVCKGIDFRDGNPSNVSLKCTRHYREMFTEIEHFFHAISVLQCLLFQSSTHGCPIGTISNYCNCGRTRIFQATTEHHIDRLTYVCTVCVCLTSSCEFIQFRAKVQVADSFVITVGIQKHEHGKYLATLHTTKHGSTRLYGCLHVPDVFRDVVYDAHF
jgi:hypothetical protein